jgi:antitoxin component HigA of HigAB toxin-antitoxin module
MVIELRKRGLIANKTDLATKLGTYNHVIGGIERGSRAATVGQLESLHELWGVSTNWLLYGIGQMFIMKETVYKAKVITI